MTGIFPKNTLTVQNCRSIYCLIVINDTHEQRIWLQFLITNKYTYS